MPDQPRTLVIIPAFNEEAALPAVLEELGTEAAGLDVLVIDDGSADATAAVARAAGVAVAPLPFNLGIGGALRTGFRYALRHGYERAVQFDADGQHIATEVRRLFAALDDGADMAVGTRFAGSSTYEVSAVRGGAMALLRLLIRLFSGKRFTDTSSGFRAFNRRTIELYAHTYPVEYMDSVEALLLAAYAGLTVTEVPVEMRPRAAGQPSNRNIKLLYHGIRLLVLLAATAPLGRRTPAEVTA
jgi:glycosyltransferase involved in cell wall biosynthesis